MTIDEMIRVLEAFKEGKPIEMSRRGEDDWQPVENPRWNFVAMDYRVGPRVVYLAYGSRGSCLGVAGRGVYPGGFTVVKFQEVLDE